VVEGKAVAAIERGKQQKIKKNKKNNNNESS
jgi:hypothetical protein